MIKVAIADDHPLIINGIIDMLSANENIEIGATYLDGAAAIAGIRKDQPDVLILDIQMPNIRGEEVALTLKKEYPDLKILALTNFDNTLYASNMIQNGAMGYLLKNTNKDTLIKAIETVHAGSRFLSEEMQMRIDDYQRKIKSQSAVKNTLTPRETDILKLLAAGKNNQQIAEELFLSKRTVENYRLNLTIKLDVKNTAALIKYAIEMGITK
jgi:DNA-binding NarL/FixJ family response regulator